MLRSICGGGSKKSTNSVLGEKVSAQSTRIYKCQLEIHTREQSIEYLSEQRALWGPEKGGMEMPLHYLDSADFLNVSVCVFYSLRWVSPGYK